MKQQSAKGRFYLKYTVQAGMIAAVYAALSLLTAPISFNMLQVRLAEAMVVLPALYPAAVPGLFIGCLITNIIGSPFGIIDIVFGSLTTLAAAFITSRVKLKWLTPLPAIVLNGIFVGLIINYMGSDGQPVWIIMALVAAGEAVAGYALGMPLLLALSKLRFKKN